MRLSEQANAACARLAGHPQLSKGTHTVHSPTIVIRPDDETPLHAATSVRVDSFVKLEAGLGMYLGELVHIASFAHIGIGGGITILDDGASVGSGGRLISGSNIAGVGHGCSAIAPDAIVERSFVHIGKNATVYAGATVLPGVTVGEGGVVAAGAVLRNDVGPGEIWAGVPARLVGIVGGEK